MNEMRKLMESIEKLDEGYNSRLAAAIEELVATNKGLSPVELVGRARLELGDEAAKYLSDKLESDGDFQDTMEEGWPQEETFDEMVEYWKQSLSSAIVRKGVFTELYKAANENIDELNAAIEDEAYSIAERYHGSGEGIGTSDVNHFIASIGHDLGVDDIFGWNKPKIKSDDEMERDKTNRYAKYNTAIRGKEGLGEADVATEFGGPYEEYENWQDKKVKVARTISGEHEGELGTVVKADKYRDENGGWQAEFDVKLDSGETIKMYPGEWSDDQLELVIDPYGDFMLDNPFEARMLELAGVPVAEAKGRKVSVPVELSNPDPKNPKATSADAEAFLHALGPDDEVDDYVVDPETGEVLFEPFMTKRGEGMDKFKSAREYHDQKETWVPSIYGADNQDDAWEELGELRHGNASAAKFYNIVWRNLGDLLGDPKDLGTDAEDWGELDYDTGYDVPVVIKRKDGKRLQEEDYDNFRTLASLVKHATGNISLSMMGTTDKGTVARFTPTLM